MTYHTTYIRRLSDGSLPLQQTSGQLGQQQASVGLSRNREIYFHETQYMQKDSFEISRCITRQNKSPLILLKNITYRIFRLVHDVMRKDTINYKYFYILTIWIFHKRKVFQYDDQEYQLFEINKCTVSTLLYCNTCMRV